MDPSTHGFFDSDALDDYHCEIHSMVVGTQQRPLSTSIHGETHGNAAGIRGVRKVVAWWVRQSLLARMERF
jgi:hypothetical protein